MSREKLPNYINAYRKQLSSGKALARRYGQLLSMQSQECVDANRMPIPWYTYPAIEYLDHFDFSKLTVFEYGSGNSTLWWARRALAVTSVENDQDWYSKIQSTIDIGQDGVSRTSYVLAKDKESYIKSLSTSHDIVIVDGRFRRGCAEHVLSSKWVNNVLMLIFDNSDWYPETIQIVRDSLNWFEADFHGFGPINRYSWTTSLFVNSNRLDALKYSKELRSVAGLAKNAESC